MTRLYAESPLRLLHATTLTRAAWIYQTNLGGGLVGGDAISLELEAGAGTRTLLTTQASTKVYGGQACRQNLSVKVHAKAFVAVISDPVTCFAGAQYEQTLSFDLEPSASLVVLDWLTCGRRAYGERWAFDRYDSRASLRRDGRTLIADRTLLAGADLEARMQRFDVLGFIWLCGALPPWPPAEGLAVSKLADDLTVVRFCAADIESAHALLSPGLAFLQEWLGENPWTRRL